MITYQVEDFNDDDNVTKVTYTNEQGYTHERTLNIPRDSDGVLDQDYWATILEDQLRGVEYKLSLNVIQFTDPNATEEYPESEPA